MSKILISTSGMLTRELAKLEDNFITVIIEDKEYVIDCVRRVPNYTDSPLKTHIALIARECCGEVKR